MPDTPDRTEPRRRSVVGATLRQIGRIYGRFVRTLMTLLAGTILIALGILFINYVVLSTPEERAYRDLDPSVSVCKDGFDRGWTALADVGRSRLDMVMAPDNDGWVDPSNDELAVIARDKVWQKRFSCALQHHIVPAVKPGHKPVDYDLGFLEFKENGEPYALVSDTDSSDASKLTTAMLKHAMESEMHRMKMSVSDVKPVITQLDVLRKHLSTGSNYVIVFIHGWRHDARIGDGNVADLRLYAANVARFLAQRCETEKRYCDTKVTAIYVGWRGERVDEQGLVDYFGETIGGFLGNLSAAVTLFDRKPVSETIAPAAISALRTLENTLLESGQNNKMVIAGHSLGGNMLATGLEDDLIKAVRRHKPGDTMPPVLGDLVFLINPASEAAKWTSIQREVWNRTAYRTDRNTTADDVLKDNNFFPDNQKPVVVSVTAALAFPAGGLRPGDCAWVGLDFDDKFAAARKKIRKRLAATDAMFDTGVDYDWATHDLFPIFKFDFRPAAAYLDRVASRIERLEPKGESCEPPRPVAALDWIKALPFRALAVLASTFPFQHATSAEQSHTIGNLDPPRPAAGVLADALPSGAPFGTTHELLGLHALGTEPHHPYATIADADIDCPAANHWLSRARAKRKDQFGLFWNSQDLAPPDPGVEGQGMPAAQFLHGLNLTGIAPITRANDPFWNIRAFDNALSRHDGYKLTSFICAFNQLVMDDITAAPPVPRTPRVDPDNPMVDPNP